MPAARIRSVRFKDGYYTDSLTNGITGQGLGADPRRGNAYVATYMTRETIAAAYEGSGMMAKVVDIPALDMVREWRDWQADKETITKLEAEEKRLDIRGKVRLAETFRGLGGGAMILGLPGDPASPAPANVRTKGIAYIHVVSRFDLGMTGIVDDHEDPRFGGPEYFTMSTTRGQQRIHPSRVIAFKGDPIASLVNSQWEERFWGRSRVARVIEAVQNSDSAQGAFASLITKARNIIIGIPGLMDLVADADGEAALQRRLAAFVLGESMYNATLRDAGDGTAGAGETIDHRQVNWAGIPEIMMAFAQFVSAVSDIPATRLLGRSPAGMNATGEGDEKNWTKMVRAKQTLELAPCVDRLDQFLIPSALGKLDAEVWYEWAPLDTPSEKERADTFLTIMTAAEKVQLTGAVPDIAFTKALQNTLVEIGALPGLEGALAEIPEAERFGGAPEDDSTDPSAMQAQQPRGGDLSQSPTPAGGEEAPARRRAANDAATWLADATPRPLYVQRKLLNAADLIAWAKANGFTSTLPADDMHVTVLYSRSPVDPMKMGRDWREDDRGEIRVRPGGPRAIEMLGENAVVLRFVSPDLEYRHSDMIEAGGSHDWPEYQPHVTLSYQVPDGVDLQALKPFNGELRFGPELFEALDLDWKSKLSEE